MQSSEIRQTLQKLLGEGLGKLSSSFMELSSQSATEGASPETLKRLDKLFKLFLDSHRALSAEINILLDHLDRTDKRDEQLLEEKRRLEVLYTSGILFSSETEMKSLMQKAIDTVVRELGADEGFIVLVNNAGEPQDIVSRNMNPDEHPDAKEMSMSVITNTLSQSSPVSMDIVTDEFHFSKQKSIIRLGITAALCVPLVSGSKVTGAVYIDRRNKDLPFGESDLLFLISFARQIVRGLDISIEISTLETRLLSEASMKFEDLRKVFACDNIIGSSKSLFEVLRIASKISPTDASVLILGENGTGKDLLAQAIHRNSPRANKPFVTINCGAIPADLLESELFGYESGAFTGATKSKPGKIELADGGTLFFDEIGELSVNLQAKLLRLIQTREIERLGGIQARKIDIRIISATNRNITDMISKNLFREDLYYRLKVIELSMPSLSDRREDIYDLFKYFVAKQSKDKIFTISNDALEVLENYNWPGNIRELENVILRCVVLTQTSTIEISDLPPELCEKVKAEPLIKFGKSLTDAETEFRRMYILKTLRETPSKAEAAKLLGVNRTHFYKLLAQLGIE